MTKEEVMISVNEAKSKLREITLEIRNRPPKRESLPLHRAQGLVISEAMTAPISIPRFDNSAMDGFALRFETTTGASEKNPISFRIVGETVAGDPPSTLATGNQTIRIMTGAPIPDGADTVIKQEDITELDGAITIVEPAEKGRNIRRIGEDIKSGQTAIEQGVRINSGAIGFLASIGIDDVYVHSNPKVSIIATGSELVTSLNDLMPGKILESNATMLRAGLNEINVTPKRVDIIDDDEEKLIHHIQNALHDSDLLILTGGASVGTYDFTTGAFKKMGIKTLFWRVNQKPGKPLLVGSYHDKLIFGLPGNPYAAFTSFYLYIRPTILALRHDPEPELVSEMLPISQSISKTDNRTHFLKGCIANGTSRTVTPLTSQGSHLLKSLVQANCLIEFPDTQSTLTKGDPVRVIHLPH